MNKRELVAKMAEKTGMTLTDAGKALNAFIDSVTEALQEGDVVQLPGFCSFRVRERAEREGINPATGERITIPAKKVVRFKAGKTLSESIQ